MKQTRTLPIVSAVREASRHMVRELGMLGRAHASLGLTNSQAHALIELEKDGALSVIELARRLCLEKSSVSRLVDSMRHDDLIRIGSSSKDGRVKVVTLAALGRKKLATIHSQADERVDRALKRLSPEEQSKVTAGLELYANALAQSRSAE